MKTNTLLAVATTISLLMGCAKDGVEGPRGPQGNANVHSETFMVTAGDWGQVAGIYRFERPVPFITSDIATSGAVMVYMSYNNVRWGAMPYIDLSINLTFDHSTGLLSLYLLDGVPQTWYFKVVAIPSSGMIPSDLDLTNYDAVKDYFKLEEK